MARTIITCSVCKGKTTREPEPATVETGICNECRDKLGIIPMGEPMRPGRPCMRCNGMKFTRVVPRANMELRMGSNGTVTGPAPMMATAVPTVNESLFGAVSGTSLYASKGVGVMEMYVCHGCGFVEWYCRDAAAIPVGPAYMAELVDYAGPTEYR